MLPSLCKVSVTALRSASRSGPSDTAKLVEFTLLGQHFAAISARPPDPFNNAVSFLVHGRDQAEIDRD